MSLRHKFSSGIPDGLDPALVKPSDWNDDHIVDFDGLAKSVGGTLLQAIAGTDYLKPDGSGALLTGLTATQVGLGNVTNESKTTMFTSPAFTGTPTGPTATVDTNTAQLSTTAFVIGQAATATPLASAVSAAVGTSTTFARADHVHPSNFTATVGDIKMNGTQSVGILTSFCRADHVHPIDTSRAPVSNPTFTGTATATSFTSTATTGTAPFTVSSTTMVSNLNAQYLGGTALSGLQPADATLTALAGLTTADNQMIYSTGVDAFAMTTLSAFGRTLIDDADAATARTTLGLGSAAVLAVGTTAGTVAAGDHNHSGVYQPVLVSGTNIKTINSISLLGSGDISVSLPDGDKGDVVVSDGGSNWTVESVAGNLAFLGIGARIRGDFSNATIASRAMFQTSTENGNTSVFAVPNGTAQIAQWLASNAADPANASLTQMVATATESQIMASRLGTGIYLPMTFYTGGSERMRIDTSGNVTLSSPAGLGYGIGAGGTVTQATSKSTAVTLNKPCGQITMHNATLAAWTTVYFTLNNSLIGAADVVCPHTYNNRYHQVDVRNMGLEWVSLAVTNITDVARSEAVVINFAIIKGAIS